jgi:hypothetical protein
LNPAQLVNALSCGRRCQQAIIINQTRTVSKTARSDCKRRSRDGSGALAQRHSIK